MTIEVRLDAFQAFVEAVAQRAVEIIAAEAAEYLRWPLKRIHNLTAAGAIRTAR